MSTKFIVGRFAEAYLKKHVCLAPIFFKPPKISWRYKRIDKKTHDKLH
jgi:hypothetical protein